MVKTFINKLLETINDINEDAIIIEYNIELIKAKKGYKIKESKVLKDIPKFLNYIKLFFP